MSAPFWETTPLAVMSETQWESLCDGCGKCCLIRLEDEDTGAIHLTDVHCRLFDGIACRCRDYVNRQAKVPDCVKLTPETVGSLSWLPRTCAYRLVAEGRPLFDWHPLVSGDASSVHDAGMSVIDATISEKAVRRRALARRIVQWPGEETIG
jgi:uncharacterized cysteine cluster protein YcgN (CxxCxxCC family)